MEKVNADFDVEKHALSSPPLSYSPILDTPAPSPNYALLSLHHLATRLDFIGIYGWTLLSLLTISTTGTIITLGFALRPSSPPALGVCTIVFSAGWLGTLLCSARSLVKSWRVREERGREEWLRFLQEILCQFVDWTAVGLLQQAIEYLGW